MSHGAKIVLVALALVVSPIACGSASSGPGGGPPGVGAAGGGGAAGSQGGGGNGGGGGTTQPASCTGAAPHASPASPLEYGENEVATTLTAAGSHANVCVMTVQAPEAQAALASSGVTLDPSPESYAIVASGTDTLVIGRDPNGAMYGAFEIAERVRLGGAGVLPLSTPIVDKATVPTRGATLYIVMQQPTEPAWWFLDPTFWSGYLDLLAHARMNFLDLRGMYNLANTIFPNPLLYFGTSQSFPAVGAPAANRAQNLAMLGAIVQMAAVRGIQVGFMIFRSDTSLTGDPGDPGTPLADADLQTYTREATASIAKAVPGLWRIGVRIGESGHAAAWFKNTVVAGLQGTGIKFYTRTWLSSKPEITDLVGAAGADPMIMAKFNGEHLAAPYVVAGGSFDEQNWAPSYSYEDYLNPPQNYSFLFEVRAGGTHRMFRYASYARTARTIASFTLAGAKGFGLEPPHAYAPQRDFYHQAEDQFSPWTFRRDELFYLLFGRLAYDPATPESVFRAALAARVGTDGLWDAVQAASDVVPWIQEANTCGPDQRDFAPDEEWGGPVGYWAEATNAPLPPASAHGCGRTDLVRIFHGPFDSFAVASPFDTAKDLVAGSGTSRVDSVDVAQLVAADAKTARGALSVTVDPNNVEARDYVRECVALADLGDYFSHKLRGATALAVYNATSSSDFLSTAESETQSADTAWTQLAQDTAYIAPFTDMMRVGANYHWSNATAWLPLDAQSIEAAVAAKPPTFTGQLPAAAAWLAAARGTGPGLPTVGISPQDPGASSWTVTASFANPLPQGAVVTLWAKPFVATADWQSFVMTASGAAAQANYPGTGGGAMFMVEVSEGPGAAWRYPDLLQATPYAVIPP